MLTLEEKLNYCAVRVNEGSGCVYQPGGTNDYSYVLTVKHNITANSHVQEVQDIIVKRGNDLINVLDRFYHQELDVAILKVGYQGDTGFNLAIGKSIKDEQLRIFGYPKYLNQGIIPIATDITCKKNLERDPNVTFELETENPLASFNRPAAENVIGFSGSGIFKYIGDQIILKGIFPRLNDAEAAHSKVIGYHLEPFNQLLRSSGLPELIPQHLVSFEFLYSESFKLDVSVLNEQKISPIRTQLKNKAWDVVQSDLVPDGIKKHFKQKLLVDDINLDYIDDELLWRTWLEFLTIMNILKEHDLRLSDIDDIFHQYCLKYSNTSKHWTTLLKSELANSDYKGLKRGSKVIVQTLHRPDDDRILRRGEIPPNIALTVDKSKFRIDMSGSPLDHFDFIHADYLYKDCIIKKLSNFENLETPDEILGALRVEYLKLFSNG